MKGKIGGIEHLRLWPDSNYRLLVTVNRCLKENGGEGLILVIVNNSACTIVIHVSHIPPSLNRCEAWGKIYYKSQVEKHTE